MVSRRQEKHVFMVEKNIFPTPQSKKGSEWVGVGVSPSGRSQGYSQAAGGYNACHTENLILTNWTQRVRSGGKVGGGGEGEGMGGEGRVGR